MDAVAISALHDQVIRRRQGFGIADDRQPRAAQVTGKAQADFSSRGLEFEKHGSGTKHVASFERLVAKAGSDPGRSMHRGRAEERKGGLGVFYGVKSRHKFIVV